MIKTPSL